MNRKTQETAYAIIVAIILLVIAINLTIDNILPSKFVCEGKIIAEKLTPVDVKSMYDTCVNKCERNNVECLQQCVDMIKVIVDATSPNSG